MQESPECFGRQHRIKSNRTHEWKDLHGKEFKLSDYRDRIVILYFTGHWCGPCRGEYPYQRLLLEILADQPAVLLGVNSDNDRETALKTKEEERLN